MNIIALIKTIKKLRLGVIVVTWGSNLYIPIPLSKEITKRLLKAKKPVKFNDTITILENKMDLSLLKLRAFEINKKVNEEINIKFLLRV